MKVLILGADGYLGWPTCMYFSARGHEIIAVDNYYKRKICQRTKEYPLIHPCLFTDRAIYWNKLDKGYSIIITVGDITDYNFLKLVFEKYMPDVVIDYAEQPSAPYSMISNDNAKETLINNTVGTLNIAHAVKEVCPDCVIIKLSTMGVYGTPNTDIPEGFFEFEYKGRKDTRLFPREAGSFYHTTKVLDDDILWFYTRMWKLAVHNICQGPVIGLLTDEMNNDPELYTTFHYGEIHGTVANRFLVQAVAGYPLTVYGKGGQTRGYLNLKDVCECVYLLAQNPPEKGEMQIINQITQTFSVNELANKISRAARDLGYITEIQHLNNPRIEKEEHYYNPKYTTLLDLGLEPNFFTNNVIREMLQVVERYKSTISKDIIFKGYKWI